MNLDRILSEAAHAAATVVEGAEEKGGEGGHHGDKESDVIFFIFFSLCLGGLVKEISKKTLIPYTPMIFVIGCFLGKYKNWLGILENPIDKLSRIDGHGLLMIFLPVLIFDGGFSCDWHLFRRQFLQIVILAFPAVVVSAFLLAFCLKVVLNYDTEHYTWTGAMLFGSILSCTDTVAVLALLKECGSPKKFNSLIEGESLLNDGVCMILFQIFSAMMKGKAASFDSAIGLFFSLTLGGMALGLIFGGLSTLWIKRIFNDEILVVNITFLTCYIMFYIAENVNLGFQISGIIALVALGLFMSAFGKTRISSEADHAVHVFWKYIVFCAETVIFVLAGILVGVEVLGNSISDLEGSDFFKIIGLYICMLIVRFVSISIFMPLLCQIAYGLNWIEVIVLAYGGLRGAIGIAFALIVKNDESFPPKFRTIVLFQMAGAAVLTLLINGTTTGLLIKRIGMIKTSHIKQRYQIQFTEKMLEEIESKINEIRSDRFLNVVNWDKVRSFNCVEEYNKYINEIEEQIRLNEKTQVKTEPPIGEQDKDVEMNVIKTSVKESFLNSVDGRGENGELDEASVTEARSKFIMALKGIYWEFFEINQISGDSLILLIESANFDLDNAINLMNSWEFISNGLINKQYMNILFKTRFTKFIGKIARNLLFNHISFAYDVVIGYIMSIEKAEKIFKTFPIDDELIFIILKESNDIKEAAESYLHHYLTVSFPEITEQVQNKKAATTILEQQKTALSENYTTGQIEERDYFFFKKLIDKSVKTLYDLVPDWHMPPIKEFLGNIPFFKFLDEKTIGFLLQNSQDLVFEADSKVIREHDKATSFFVITRGCGSEQKGNYQEKKNVGCLISPIHLIQESFRYQTNFVTESLFYCISFKINDLNKILKNNDELNEYVWKESLKTLIKLNPDETKPLPSLDNEDLSHLLTNSYLRKYKPGKVIDLCNGGVFLRGHATEKIEKPEKKDSTIKEKKEEENISPITSPKVLINPPNEDDLKPIQEEEEPEQKELFKPNTKKEDSTNRPSKISRLDSEHEKEYPKELDSLICIPPLLPNIKLLYQAQKPCLVLHFTRNEENELIFSERKQIKPWYGSVVSRPHTKISVKRSFRPEQPKNSNRDKENKQF